MATQVLLPKQGQTVEKCLIVRWIKIAGDQVLKGEPLFEIETDKSVMEVESPSSGTLLEVFYGDGEEVPVLTTVALIGKPGEDLSSLRLETPVEQIPSPAEQVDMQGRHVNASQINSPESHGEPIISTSSEAQKSVQAGVSPRAGNLARAKGLSLVGVFGSGPGGRIIERDVRAALASRSTETQPGMQEGVEAIPVKGVRRLIAERMLNSLQTTAQLTLHATADARALSDFRKRLKDIPEPLGLQEITINHLVLFAVSRSLLKHPELNALFQDDRIYRYQSVHLAFAVDTPRGLVVPVIHNADRLSLMQISLEAKRLSAACMEGNLSPAELSGGTFTVSNLGNLDIESFTPILNPPQVGILGVGNISLKPIESEEKVVFQPRLGLSLTINHQVVDGAPGARFLQTLAQGIGNIDILAFI